MEAYLKGNLNYWSRGYEAENVESFVFRPYGRIFTWELGIDGSKRERLLDFGCGEGASLRFFKSKGFDVYGVDISEVDIARARAGMRDIQDHFKVIDPKPRADTRYFPEVPHFDVVTAIQSLFYFTNADLATCLQSLHAQMKPGGVIYATMVGTKSWYYKHSRPEHDGLSVLDFDRPRLKVHDYHANFTASREELIEKFSLFKKLHVGYYDTCFREDEGNEFFWVFVGRKE